MVRHIREFVLSVPFLILFAVIFLCIGISDDKATAEKPKSNPHELKEKFDGMECVNCHRQTPGRIPEDNTRTVLPGLDDFVIDPVAMCAPCHEGSMDSHPIAVRPKYRVPADLPLDKKRGVSCLTCHYTHGRLISERPCCSVSLLDRMFNRERMRRSFLLRRENANGELCKACHVK